MDGGDELNRGLTEHQLQRWLTSRWLRTGIPLGDNTATLIAWEVMLPTWRINDAHSGFGQPAIDFLGLDNAGGLIAIELKRYIGGPRCALRAACQVSHLASGIDQSKTTELVRSAHGACFGGTHGRTHPRRTRPPEPDLGRPTRAVLAAPSWSSGAAGVLAEFSARSPQANAEYLDQLGLLQDTNQTNRVCLRYAAQQALVQPRIELLVTDSPLPPSRR